MIARSFTLRVALASALLLALAMVRPALAQSALPVTVPSLDGSADARVSLPAMWFPLSQPAGGTAPALVLLHGGGGMYGGRGGAAAGRLSERMTEVVAWLASMGVQALVLDSLTPRGETELCTQKTSQRAVTQHHRRLDALGALQWLASQPGVDATRLGLLGWSNGGSTVLAATNGRRAEVREAAVKADLAVAYYPGCEADLKAGYTPTARLLMLVGADDDWTPAAPCESLARAASGNRVEIEVYAGAYHGFDGTAPVRHRTDVPNGARPGRGVHVGGHAPSRQASRDRLAAFLKQHWRLP